MAGANNAQLKRAGWKAKDITKARATVGKLSHGALREAGYTPKAYSHAAKQIGAERKPKGWGAGMSASEKAAARAGREAFVARREAGKARRAELAGRGLRAITSSMLARRKADAQPSLEKSLGRFRDNVHAAFDRYYGRSSASRVPRLEFQEGGRYIRVVRNDGTSRSAHSFIDKATGDIYKAASYKAPAKGVRGNIHRGEFGLTDMGSVQYAARRGG